MRIIDWSSDVCSFDLPGGALCLIEGIGKAPGVQHLYFGIQPLKEHFERVAQQIMVIGEQNSHGSTTSRYWLHRISVLAQSDSSCNCDWKFAGKRGGSRSEEHTSELQSLMRISYAVFCLKKKNTR